MMRNLLFLCGFATIAVAQPAIGTSTVTRDYSFPPVGLASSEIAQVNVVNLAPTPTAAGAAAPTCSGTIAFANAGGKAIGSPVSYTTTGSQVFSTQLTFSQLGGTGTRAEFVASVQATGSFLLSSRALCVLGFSLETFDESSGVTHVYLGSSTATSALPTGPFIPAEGR